MNKDKEQLRLQQRRKMDQRNRELSSEASNQITARCLLLSEVQRAKTLFVYVSKPAEVATDDLIITLLEQGKRICVPRVISKEKMIPVELRSLEQLSEGKYGFREPQSQVSFEPRVDLIIVPGLAFDTYGNRLGYGGGYYDRYLAAASPPVSIGLAFQWQILESIPMESHDHRINQVLTENFLYN